MLSFFPLRRNQKGSSKATEKWFVTKVKRMGFGSRLGPHLTQTDHKKNPTFHGWVSTYPDVFFWAKGNFSIHSIPSFFFWHLSLTSLSSLSVRVWVKEPEGARGGSGTRVSRLRVRSAWCRRTADCCWRCHSQRRAWMCACATESLNELKAVAWKQANFLSVFPLTSFPSTPRCILLSTSVHSHSRYN